MRLSQSNSICLFVCCCVLFFRGRGRAREIGSPYLTELNQRMNEVDARNESLAKTIEEMGARNENMTKSMETMMAMLHNLTQQQQNTGASHSETRTEESSDGNEVRREEGVDDDYLKYLGKFQNMNPKKFRGTSDPDKAEEWALLMEKYFAVLRCPERYKVFLAVMTLEGEAEHWWRALQRRAESTHQQISWRYFLTAFYDKYFSRTVRIRKTAEFDALNQGKMYVDEYEAKFSALLRFAPHVEADELLKATKFRNGLRYEVRRSILGEHDYFEIVQKAQEAERDLQLEAQESDKDQIRSRKAQQQFLQKKSEKRQKSNKRKSEGSSFTTPSVSATGVCRVCNRSHGDKPCYVRTGMCFICGKPGHFMATCPQNSEQQRSTQPTKPRAPQRSNPTVAQSGVQGRVYALIGDEVAPTPTRASGT